MPEKSFLPGPNDIVIEISSGSESEEEEEEVFLQFPTRRLTRSARASKRTSSLEVSRIDKRKKGSVQDNQDSASTSKTKPLSVLKRRGTKRTETNISSSKSSGNPTKKNVGIEEEQIDEDFVSNENALISLAATLLSQTMNHGNDEKEEPDLITNSKSKEEKTELVSNAKRQKADFPSLLPLRKSSRQNKAMKEPMKESMKEKSAIANTKRRRDLSSGKEAASKIPLAKSKLISNTINDENVNGINQGQKFTEQQKRESVRNFLLKELSKFGKDQKRIESLSSDIEDEMHKHYEGELYKSQFRRAITALRNHKAGFGRHLYSLSLQAREFARMNADDMVSQAQKLSAKELKEAELRKIMLNPITNRDINEMKKTSIKLESYMVSTGISLDEDDYLNT